MTDGTGSADRKAEAERLSDTLQYGYSKQDGRENPSGFVKGCYYGGAVRRF